MRIRIVVTAVIASFCLASAAYACSCPPPPPPEKALEQAAAVFSGKVLKIAEADEHHLQVTFQIAATWKGTEGKQVVVLTGKNDGICGYKFEPGKSYLVYAGETVRGKVKHLATGICHRTAPLAAATDDLQDLGPGQKPE